MVSPSGDLRCASYVRTSGNARSLAEQRQRCRDHARNLDLPISPDLEFCDQAPSNAEREGLRRLLEAAERREFDVLITCGLDRLTRNSAELGPTLAKLNNEFGIQVVRLDDRAAVSADDN